MKTRILLLAAAALALAAAAAGAAPKPYPDVIPLPNGFQPEGIAVGRGTTFYVGSIPTGDVYRGNLRTGTGSVLVDAPEGRAAIGVEHDRRHNRLFVAGGPTGHGFVYDARTGRSLADLAFTGAPTFVNDVVVTRDAAWFTDSQRPQLYRVALGKRGAIGAVTTVPLTGDYEHVAGAFNLNGIDATANGKTLVVVQSATGKLFTVTPTGVTREIDLGGAVMTNGDGLLLTGRTLFVVQNRLNRIARVALDPQLRSGRVVKTIEDADFDVPTTIDDLGRRLYAVNARFGTPAGPATTYQVVQVRK